MAVPKSPKKKPARRVKPRSVEDFFNFLASFGPDPEWADGIEAAYKQRHVGFEEPEEGAPPRRRSTRKS